MEIYIVVGCLLAAFGFGFLAGWDLGRKKSRVLSYYCMQPGCGFMVETSDIQVYNESIDLHRDLKRHG